ncbi:hypothetical protein [Plesiomonas shigelloides]
MNNAGIRDTAHVLNISINVVVLTLKTLATTNNIVSDGSC